MEPYIERRGGVRRPKLTLAKITQIKLLYGTMPTTEIAKQLGVSQPVVSKYGTETGKPKFKPEPKNNKPLLYDQVLARYAAGATTYEIAAELMRTPTRICQIRKWKPTT